MNIDEESESQQQEPYVPLESKSKELYFVVPQSKQKLRACLKCHLLKNEEMWKNDAKCQNCGPMPDDDYKRTTSAKYESVVTIIDPSKSWLRRKIRLPYGNKIVSGSYAVIVL